MVRVGVFALNLSRKSGGVFSLIDHLAQTAHLSRHEVVYLCPEPDAATDLPANVRRIGRPRAARLATQAALRMPGIDLAVRGRRRAETMLAMLGGVSPSVWDEADLWLWPHAFRPVPRLPEPVAICHDLIHRHHPELFSAGDIRRREAAQRSLIRCPVVLCPSEATRRDLVSAHPELTDRARVFAEAPTQDLTVVECTQERRALRERVGDVPLLLYVAVDWPHKNHELLLRAAATLRTRMSRGGSAFRLLLVGHRRTGRLGRMIEEAAVGDVVTDLGGVDTATLAACYREATTLLFPSLCEGFGLPLVEAMGMRLPILAADTSCIPEVCGDAAVLLPPNDPDAWADAATQVLRDDPHRESLAHKAADRAGAFTWERTWRELDEVFDEVAKM